ncbi:hypothetical protein JOF28_002312 [Leucobacter exalbidus]|uniref:GerMN domain-containing protein n=1 Tax=Leucobacter exalbidus TaxID=662960 RepID=A0A940PVN4_9MICO|nr:LpqB family beta-propeller domain-containing protein [Leucobacter exalbidus]MBP1327080.1 hypothetical protein [Leucobacter exalbidus]
MQQRRRRRNARTPLARVAVLAVIALLAGCAAIPGAGNVKVGLTDLEQAEQFYQFTPQSPTAQASQEDIVRGFVAAATSNADDYAVAREFLSTEYANQWDPYYGVLIDEGSRPYRAAGDTAGVLSLSATAKVDEAGQMLPVEPGPATDMRFEFTRIDGEWRIASAPSGIILDKSMFLAIWSSHQLYFVGTNEILVPVTRWFVAGAALATEIVGALVRGPSEHMRESLHSGFPAGAVLVTKAVPVLDGRARIDMSSEVLQASPQAIAELRQQLKLSLQSIPGVNGFDLLVEGTAMSELGGGIEPELVNEIAMPTGLIDGVFGAVSGGELTPMLGFADRVGELDPQAITLSIDGTQMAVLSEPGVTRLDAAGSALLDTRAKQIAPSIDVFGFLWTATRSGELQARGGDGVAIQVPAPWLDGRKVAAVRLAPDGARIAALVASEGGAQLLIAGVVRDDQGTPIRTTDEAATELWVTGDPLDFDWVGPTKFAVLSKGATATKVTSGGPGTFSTEQGSIPGGRQLTGGGAYAQLRVLGSEGDLYAPQNSGWQRGDYDIEVLAKRG